MSVAGADDNYDRTIKLAEEDDAGFSGDETGISQTQLDLLESRPFCPGIPGGNTKVVFTRKRERGSAVASEDSADLIDTMKSAKSDKDTSKRQAVIDVKEDDDAGFSGDEAGITQQQLHFLESKACIKE